MHFKVSEIKPHGHLWLKVLSTMKYKYNLNETITLEINATNFHCKFEDVPVDFYWYGYILEILGILLTIISFGFIFTYKNPLVAKLYNNPKELLNLNIEQLKEVEERLSKIARFKDTLTQNNITTERYKNAIAFKHFTQKEKANYIAKRLFAKPTELTKQSYMLKTKRRLPSKCQTVYSILFNRK